MELSLFMFALALTRQIQLLIRYITIIWFYLLKYSGTAGAITTNFCLTLFYVRFISHPLMCESQSVELEPLSIPDTSIQKFHFGIICLD